MRILGRFCGVWYFGFYLFRFCMIVAKFCKISKIKKFLGKNQAILQSPFNALNTTLLRHNIKSTKTHKNLVSILQGSQILSIKKYYQSKDCIPTAFVSGNKKLLL